MMSEMWEIVVPKAAPRCSILAPSLMWILVHAARAAASKLVVASTMKAWILQGSDSWQPEHLPFLHRWRHPRADGAPSLYFSPIDFVPGPPGHTSLYSNYFNETVMLKLSKSDNHSFLLQWVLFHTSLTVTVNFIVKRIAKLNWGLIMSSVIPNLRPFLNHMCYPRVSCALYHRSDISKHRYYFFFFQ